MPSIACKDLGQKDCSFVATDETREGAIRKIKDHAAEAHPDVQVSDNQLNKAVA